MAIVKLTITLSVPEGVEIEVVDIAQEVIAQVAEQAPIVHITDEAIPAERHESSVWSVEEDGILQDLTLTNADCAELLGRTYSAVSSRRYALGIKVTDRVRVIREAKRAMARWTELEVLYLREQIALDADMELVAQSLGRSVDAVRVRRSAILRELAE